MPGMRKTMQEFGKGHLHSGSKKGPKVTSRKQAMAIGLNQQRDGDVVERPSLKALAR